MLHHIVMWKFAAEADGHSKEENMARARAALLALPAKIPEIRSMRVERDMGLDAGAFDMCLVSEFDDAESLKRYAVHPEHKAVSALIGKVREGRGVIDFTD
jgi:quinol monooxygenase YgiN